MPEPVSDRSATTPRCRRLFALEQAARSARVPINEVRCWIITGKLKAYDVGGGRIRIDEVELTDFLSVRRAGKG